MAKLRNLLCGPPCGRKAAQALPSDVIEAAALQELDASGDISISAAAAIRLLLLTGARVSEILSARWEWIDWSRRVLRLPDSKTGECWRGYRPEPTGTRTPAGPYANANHTRLCARRHRSCACRGKRHRSCALRNDEPCSVRAVARMTRLLGIVRTVKSTLTI